MILTLRENAIITLAPVGFMFYVGFYWPAVASAALGLYLLYLDSSKMELKDKETGAPYLTRWKLVRCRLFRVFVHRIYAPDKDRDLHNHPWPFAFAIVLRGGYDERRVGEDSGFRRRRYSYRQFSVNLLTPDCYHRIEKVEPGTWTLFVAGPRSRRWGFLQNGTTHVDATEYLGLPRNHDWKD